MRKSRELNCDFSAVCVLITKHLAKLEKSHSDNLRFFVQSFRWNLVQLLGNFLTLTSRVFKPNENGPIV